MVLEPSEIKAFYDSFGKKQDNQGYYEDAAIEDLVANSDLAESKDIFEFGCGTGRLAHLLMEEHLSSAAKYLGCDLSNTMTDLAKERLQIFGDRAQVVQSDSKLKFPLPDNSVDRVLSTYVLDLLSEADIKEFLLESHRVLKDEGKLSLASLTRGTTFLSRTVSNIWTTVFKLRGSLVGGCRPIQLDRFFNLDYWQIEHRRVIISFGVPSEVIIARAIYPS